MAKYVRVTVHHVDGPVVGLVLNWRNDDGAVHGLVTYELRGRVVTDWVPAMSLSVVDEGSSVPDDDSDEVDGRSDDGAVPMPG